MTRYIEYIGNKRVKIIPNGKGGHYQFTKGVMLDATAVSPKALDRILRTRLFRLIDHPAPKVEVTPRRPAMNPLRNICPCGYVGKTEEQLENHKARCRECS